MDRSHIPKGDMCMSCKHKAEDCSALDFESMRVIGTYPDGICVVRCTEFKQLSTTSYTTT